MRQPSMLISFVFMCAACSSSGGSNKGDAAAGRGGRGGSGGGGGSTAPGGASGTAGTVTSVGGSTAPGGRTGASDFGGSGGATGLGGSSGRGGTTAVGSPACPAVTLNGIDAQKLTGDSTPLQTASYGVRNLSAPVLIDGKHDPANYRAAPVKPTWQFATGDPTDGRLTDLECAVAPDVGFHGYHRKDGSASSHEKVVVTGGRNAVT